MNESFSLNTKAILLLTAPLLLGRAKSSSAQVVAALTQGEYSQVARTLRERSAKPADLLIAGADALLGELSSIVPLDRLKYLLDRGFLMSQVVERWRSRNIWLVSRADPQYPARLRRRLKEKAPPVLYGCGDINYLNSGGLAVIGSRSISEDMVSYSDQVGRTATRAKMSIISGGARGVDLAAMNGALDAGGQAIGVLADNLEKAVTQREHRDFILNDQLLLVSPYDPAAGFNVGNAMQRNKIIYALSDIALVVNSDYGKGGTWAGAVEQLTKHRFVPVYVRQHLPGEKGLAVLHEKGALIWPDSQSIPEIEGTIQEHELPSDSANWHAGSLFDHVSTGVNSAENPLSGNPVDYGNKAAPSLASSTEGEERADGFLPATELYTIVRQLVCQIAASPKSEEEIANELQISKGQAKEWLRRMLDEKVLEKLSRPVRYRTIAHQENLFQGD